MAKILRAPDTRAIVCPGYIRQSRAWTRRWATTGALRGSRSCCASATELLTHSLRPTRSWPEWRHVSGKAYGVGVDAMMGHVRTLSQKYPHRHSGEPDEELAVEYIA